VLSPAGRAVGVDDNGEVVGTTSYERLRVAIHAAEEADQRGPVDLAPEAAGP
jgi:hypothetical protein